MTQRRKRLGGTAVVTETKPKTEYSHIEQIEQDEQQIIGLSKITEKNSDKFEVLRRQIINKQPGDFTKITERRSTEEPSQLMRAVITKSFRESQPTVQLSETGTYIQSSGTTNSSERVSLPFHNISAKERILSSSGQSR